MSDELLKLAARCEAATGPDRELDGSIWWAVLKPEEIESIDRTGFVRECIERDGSAGKALAQFYDSSDPACLAKIAFSRPFTASLDAAMMLVPEGWRVRDFGDWEDRWLLSLMNEDTCETVEARSGRGLPALALCAAALRARHAAMEAGK